MDKTQLIALMSAIVFAGADSATESSGYDFDQAVRRARMLYEETYRQLAAEDSSKKIQTASRNAFPKIAESI